MLGRPKEDNSSMFDQQTRMAEEGINGHIEEQFSQRVRVYGNDGKYG
jgi:hypothetical protein